MKELLAKRAELQAKIDAILSSANLTEAQVKDHDDLVAAYDANEKRIAMQDSADSRAAKAKEDADKRKAAEVKAAAEIKPTGTRISDKDTPTGTARTDSEGRVTSFFEETDETVTAIQTNAQVRRQSYRQLKKANERTLRTAGYQPWGEFKNFADFARAGFSSGGTQRFDDRVNRHYAAVPGMSEGLGSDGGYTVMPEFAQGIIDRMYSNSLWSMTDNYPVSGNNMTFLANAETSRANGSRHGGLRGYWLGEGASITSSKPTLREVSLKLVKLGVVVYLTQELIDDGGAALQTFVARKAAEEFNFMLGDSLVNGTGAGQPLGMLNSPSLLSVAKETGQLAATIQTENIVKMRSRFFAPNMGNAVWLHNQDIDPQLHLMTIGVGTGGVVTYLPPGGLSSSPYANLMGRPAMPTEFNATLGTQGDIILADLGQILSISKGGVAQAVSMHLQFLTDQLAIRFIIRVNASPWESAAITPFKGSNTQSNFITLDTRS